MANYFTRKEPAGLGDRAATPARQARQAQEDPDREYLAQDCAATWRDFSLQPGTQLRLERAGIMRRDLRTAERETVASLRGLQPSAVRAQRALNRQVKARRKHPRTAAREHTSWGELRDKTGRPLLYVSGSDFSHAAGACITFPDQRWLRFPVRGTTRANAIMTAVDQDGTKVARYRIIGKPWTITQDTMEFTVHPGQPLTDELVLAIAISTPWLS